MKLSQLASLLLCAGALLVFALWQRPVPGSLTAFEPSAFFDTCPRPASTKSLISASRLSLAGEIVPLHQKRVRARLERELSRYISYPSQTRYMAARARRCFKVIDPILKQYGVPRDFRYVVAVESAFEDDAVSRRGATGIWQLMTVPAQQVGLRMNDEVDERLHLEKSTEAACRYLRFLKRETGSWTGALAAYNCGVTRFQRAAGRSGSDDYYKMWICRETGRYVFRVLAVKEIMERPGLYGVELGRTRLGWPDSRRVRVSEPVELAAFARYHKTDVESLRELNPWLVGRRLTPTKGKPYFVLVSRQPVPRLATAEAEFMRADSSAHRMFATRIDSVAFTPDQI